MSKLCYVDKKFSKDHLAIIEAANYLLDGYASQGLKVTLRQLYYQFVHRNWIRNNQSEYNRLGNIISDGRLAGLVSWTAIEDRGRSLKGLETWVSPGQAINDAAQSYRIDMWADQQWRPEVWVEKQALEGVISSICNELRVDFYATKGYNSQSEQWAAGQRMARYVSKGQRPIVFHLGDHDPSGLDMTRDNHERLSMFAGVRVPVVRLALNMDQIEKYGPPPNPAKMSDSRAEGYVKQFGYDSWELDALEPSVIRTLIRVAVQDLIEPTKWDLRAEREAGDKRVMEDFAS